MMVRTLIRELQSKCELELHEVPERVADDINYIKDWLTKQPHLKTPIDDQWILTFLRGCKFSFEKTKQKLEHFYMTRTSLPEYFSDRDPFLPQLQEILNSGCCFALPKPTCSSGECVIFFIMNRFDPSRMDLDDILKILFMTCDILLNEDDNFIVSGMSIVADTNGFTLDHVKAVQPRSVRNFSACLMKSYPIRTKGLHYLAVPTILDAFLTFIRPFLGEKLSKRIHTYTKENTSECYKIIPKEILPEEYGGEAASVEKLKNDWKKKVESYKKWFLIESQYGYNKKMVNLNTSKHNFGIDGSFRKLNID